MPVHGSAAIPVSVLHDWRSELIAAQADYFLASSALTVASATKTAADAQAKAAKAKAKAAKADVQVAGARLDEADKRQKLAWMQYLGLVSAVCLETAGELGESGSVALSQSTSAGKGKGKVRSTLHTLEGEDEIIDEELGLGDGDGDIVMR